MVSITTSQIALLAPFALPNYKQAFLNADAVLAKYQINTSALRVAHFMAQVLHESGRLTIQEENLNYKTAKRVHDVWPDRFPMNKTATDPYASAEPYLNKPHQLADKVYFGRMGNVVAQDDGYTYRGRGLIQITGREDYDYYGKKIGIDLVGSPELAYDARYAVELAAAEWSRKGCSASADADDLKGVTRKINGGLTDLDARQAMLNEAKKQWPSGTASQPSATPHPATSAAGKHPKKPR